MKWMRSVGLFALALAAIWALAASTGAQARDKGKEKDKGEKDKKKNERTIDKERATYKPHSIADKDMIEWTNGDPPGWSHGNKTGWDGAGAPPGQMKGHEQEILHIYPRGSDSWDIRRKEEWYGKLEQSRVKMLERIRNRAGMSREDEESAIISINGAAREGVPLEHIELALNRAIIRGMRGRDTEKMTRAMSYGVDKNADYNRLNRLMDRKMNEGETGDALALSIYREIDEQHAGKPEEPVKRSWWQRLFGG